MKALANKYCKLFFMSFGMLLRLFSLSIFTIPCSAESLKNEALINEFYKVHTGLYWIGFSEKQEMFISLLERAPNSGLDPQKYHYTYLKQSNCSFVNDSEKRNIDKIFTDALISYCRDLYKGDNVDAEMRYNGFTSEYGKRDDDYILQSLLALTNTRDLRAFIVELEPTDSAYEILKTEMTFQLQINSNKVRQIAKTLNYYRWIAHFKFDRVILVNIPSARLQYYELNCLKFSTKVVLGKPSTKTPCFAAYCTGITIYPYWNVPADIGRKEIFPLFKGHSASANNMGMQIIDRNGRLIDYRAIQWNNYTALTFPYRFRQETGCNNALGVMRFNLTDPFNVYLHDTNFKNAFLLNKRYFSHGCIRVERPMILGNYLTNNGIDTSFLKACKKNEIPISIPLIDKVPIIVSYLTATVDSLGHIQYLADVYNINY